MTIKFSRAQRRADRARLKKKRQFHWAYGHKVQWAGRPPKEARGAINFMPDDVAGKVVDTPTPCSCWMCGNPRRGAAWSHDYGTITLQEYKALLSYYDQVEDLYYTNEDYNIDVFGWDFDFWDGFPDYDCIEDYLEWEAKRTLDKIWFYDIGVWYEQETRRPNGS